MTNASGKPTKNERREQAREQARQLREQAKKRETRNRIFLQIGIIVGVLAVAAVVTLVIITSITPPGPGPRNMASDGILIEAGGDVKDTPALEAGEAPVPNEQPDDGGIHIQMYVDYQCPYCQQFEGTNSEYIRDLVETGRASLEIFPVAFLDNASLGTRYSSRAMNAAACVADQQPSSYLTFNELLYTNQPAEGTTGLTNAELIDFAAEAGASGQAIEDCINNETFRSWVKAATDRGLALISGTPTVYVNGQQYQGPLGETRNTAGEITVTLEQAADTFRQFVVSAQGQVDLEEIQSTSTPSPSPTPTPTAS